MSTCVKKSILITNQVRSFNKAAYYSRKSNCYKLATVCTLKRLIIVLDRITEVKDTSQVQAELMGAATRMQTKNKRRQ